MRVEWHRSSRAAHAAAKRSDVAEADIISITVFDDAREFGDRRQRTGDAMLAIVAIHSTTADTTAVDSPVRRRRGSIVCTGRYGAAAPPRVSWPMVGADDEAFQRD